MANSSKIKEYRFEIFKSDEDLKFYWHQKAVRGGKIVAQSQGYTRRGSALTTVLNIARNFMIDPAVWILERDGVTPVKY